MLICDAVRVLLVRSRPKVVIAYLAFVYFFAFCHFLCPLWKKKSFFVHTFLDNTRITHSKRNKDEFSICGDDAARDVQADAAAAAA